MKIMITQRRLKELFSYDEKSGDLTWRPQPRGHFGSESAFASFNSRCLNRVAGCSNPLGYRVVRVGRVGYLVHRLIWCYHFGDDALPDGMQIDHIDHDRGNNRIDNLRVASQQENQRNKAIYKINKSGVVGVRLVKKTGKWRASILGGRQSVYLGEFSKLDDAVAARKSAELKYGFHQNHGLTA